MNDRNDHQNVTGDLPETRFPALLYQLLTEIETSAVPGLEAVVGFQPHGYVFKVFDECRFVAEVLPVWFELADWESFLEWLYSYGFRRVTQDGADQGGFYHKFFLRGQAHLAQEIRQEEATNGYEDEEPDFSLLPIMPMNRQAAASRRAEHSQRSAPSPGDQTLAPGSLGLPVLPNLMMSGNRTLQDVMNELADAMDDADGAFPPPPPDF